MKPKTQITELIADSQQKQARIHTLENEVVSKIRRTNPSHRGTQSRRDPKSSLVIDSSSSTFLTKCQLKFLGWKISRFPDEKSKVHYTGALLKSSAFLDSNHTSPKQ